jgi:hypothetical protein
MNHREPLTVARSENLQEIQPAIVRAITAGASEDHYPDALSADQS